MVAATSLDIYGREDPRYGQKAVSRNSHKAPSWQWADTVSQYIRGESPAKHMRCWGGAWVVHTYMYRRRPTLLTMDA